jgi:hypothetical protein
MRVYFTTIVRTAPIPEAGEVVRLDWAQKTVEAHVPIFPENPTLEDPNPRGNTRGGRGIALFDGQVVATSYHTLRIYDEALNPLQDVTHPLLVGLHEVAEDSTNRRVWATSTAIDAVLEIDLESGEIARQFWPREMPGFQAALGLQPLTIDKSADNRGLFLSREHLENPYHLHLNAVYPWNGELYVLFNAFGAIVNLDRDEVVIQERSLRGGHNLLIREDGLAFVNDTLGHGVRIYDLNKRMLVKAIDLLSFEWVRELVGSDLTTHRWARLLGRWPRAAKLVRSTLGRLGLITVTPSVSLFVRGLDRIGDRLFVGFSPASVVCIDWEREELIDVFNYSRDPHVCVHGLRVVPD